MAKTYVGSPIEYDPIREIGVMVPMRDGVKLATDIYFPAIGGQRAPGKFPVILKRSPYDRQSPGNPTEGKFFARRGYVYATQDVRGRFDSEGEFYAFAKEAPDGYDAVEWLGVQPWSDGQIGTLGGSYSGSDQAALATLNPPHLATMTVAFGAANYYHKLHAAKRRAGAAVPRLRLSHGPGQQGGEGGPGYQGGADQDVHSGYGRRRQPVSSERGRHRASQAALLRAVGHRHPDPRRLRRLLEAAGLRHVRVLRPVRGRSDPPYRRMVRLLYSQ